MAFLVRRHIRSNTSTGRYRSRFASRKCTVQFSGVTSPTLNRDSLWFVPFLSGKYLTAIVNTLSVSRQVHSLFIPKSFLRRGRSSATSFNFWYALVSSRPPSSHLSLLPRLPVSSTRCLSHDRSIASSFQSQFYRQGDLVLPLSISGTLSFLQGHPLAI